MSDQIHICTYIHHWVVRSVTVFLTTTMKQRKWLLLEGASQVYHNASPTITTTVKSSVVFLPKGSSVVVYPVSIMKLFNLLLYFICVMSMFVCVVTWGWISSFWEFSLLCHFPGVKGKIGKDEKSWKKGKENR